MGRGKTWYLAWGLCAASLACALAQLVLWLSRLTAMPTLHDASEHLVVNLTMPVVFSVLAAMIIARQPSNATGWLMMISGVSLALTGLMSAIVLDPLAGPPQALNRGLWIALWFNAWSWIPFIFAIFLLPLYFPTGSPPTPRWRWVAWLALGMWVTFLVLSALTSEVEYADWTVPNPIGVLPSALWEGPLLAVWGGLLLTTVAASVASLFVRYRRAGSTERQQIRWLLFAGAAFVIVYAVAFFSPGGFVASEWLEIVFLLSILAFPAAIALAIFRYRLWDLDVVVNRALIYGPLTTLLAATFAVVIALTNELTKQALGAQSRALGAAISAMIVAVFFQPVRGRIEKLVDARFYPQKLDLASGLVEVQAPYWGFLDESILMRRSMEHVRRVLGTRHAAFFRATAPGCFELEHRLDEGTLAVKLLGLSEKQQRELEKGRVIAAQAGGPLINHVPIYVDRGKTNELLGLLSIGARDNGRGYSGDDLRGLAELGAKIGLALNAVHLGQALRQRRG